MILQEEVKYGGRVLVRTWSDANKYIIQRETGIKYIDAIDIPNKYTYIESEEDIVTEENREE